MNRRLLPSLIVGAALLLPGSVAGQMQAEVRGGLTIGSQTDSYAALDIAPAISLDVVIRRQVTPAFAVFGGFFRTAFGCEQALCKPNQEDDPAVTVVGTHGVLGVEWGSGGPWLRSGLMLGTVQVTDRGDAPEMGIGLHAAGGLTVGSGSFRFLPGLSYRWMQSKSASDNAKSIALSLDLGFAYQISGGGS
jgi:hypothetical protein